MVAAVGGALGILMEVLKLATKGRMSLSAIGMGLAFVIPFTTCFAMFLGSFLFWIAAKAFTNKEGLLNRVFVDNLEPVCAGIIAGGALTGIGAAMVERFLL